ncbi:MAG: SUF system Fe-S cluster assembly regulator [Nitrococcus sp.]|nr:SUF system Fe-S cluster assembly regulator [Nitrococcus sp.]
MIRINRETDYGISILTLMARRRQERFNAAELAQWRGLPQPMVSKILKHLARSQILVSYRGVQGGYTLARSPEQISLADIIVALEGPIALTECVVGGADTCQYGSNCAVSARWRHINQKIRTALEAISLAEMDVSEPTGGASGVQAITVHHSCV